MTDYAGIAQSLAARAQAAAEILRAAPTAQKDAFLRRLADALEAHQSQILARNRLDMGAGRDRGLTAALLDRLELDEARIAGIAQQVRDVARLPDPVGALTPWQKQSSGIEVARMRVPLGVVLMVYESRPNVTVDTAALCLKAGNAVILRGGKEAFQTNQALSDLVRQALRDEGLPDDGAVFVDDTARDLLYRLLEQSGRIDLAIPRGGTSLIEAVDAHAKVPVLQHYQGICHVYVHQAADLDMAERITINAKVQRPGVCNAAEGLIVDEAVARAFLPRVVAELISRGVEVRGCDKTAALADGVVPAGPADFDTEFLDLTLAVKVVAGLDEALAFIAQHGSGHTESIITTDEDAAARFVRTVDASCVLHNASTRFNDGGALGLGAELGISTTKLHAYGPMGLEELCTRKFVVRGTGQTRGDVP